MLNDVQVMNLIGDVKGKVAVMVDDMIDTAGMRFSAELMNLIATECYDFCLFMQKHAVPYRYFPSFSIPMLHTGTIANSAALLHAEGAKEVYACCTHAVFR